jgi:protein-tyrosine phosphatase
MTPFRILVVCTGNICRSPMAQVLLTHRLRARLGADLADAAVEVTSAGTYGLVGHPIEAAALDVLSSYGVEPDPFAARELTGSHVTESDLILGATREHRAAAVTLVPRAAGRTFTLREFARLAAAVDQNSVGREIVQAGSGPAEVADRAEAVAERARAVVEAAARNRGYVRADSPADDDVADPYRRAASAFELAGRHISAAVDTIVDCLLGRT